METIATYIFDKKQVVVVDGLKSDVLNVETGVSQGSRLGTLLFII